MSGDWQFGGIPIKPDFVSGTWKYFTRTVDKTKSDKTKSDKTKSNVTLNADADPKKNNWNLGPYSDLVPQNLPNQGYGAEVRWNINDPDLGLISGHTYRFYVMVHDGDQNKDGGDVGQACVNLRYVAK
jgi:hypothetical protein